MYAPPICHSLRLFKPINFMMRPSHCAQIKLLPFSSLRQSDEYISAWLIPPYSRKNLSNLAAWISCQGKALVHLPGRSCLFYMIISAGWFIQRMLKKLGIKANAASNGLEAISALEMISYEYQEAGLIFIL